MSSTILNNFITFVAFSSFYIHELIYGVGE